MTVNEYMNQFI
jgi:hypothetical protein